MPEIQYYIGKEPIYTQADLDRATSQLRSENRSYDLTLTKVMGALESYMVRIRDLEAEVARLKCEIQNAAYEQQLDANVAVEANNAAAKFQAENDELRKALREVINRAVLETGTTWKDTANDMANIAHAALMPF